MIESTIQIDAKGLACPMPIIKTKKAIQTLDDGQVLEVQATDVGSTADLAAWSKSSGHQYIGTKQQGDILFHYIRKCNPEVNDSIEKTFEQTVTNEEAIAGNGILLDVRESVEFAFGHIPNAISIPLGSLEDRLNELQKEECIYIICRTGTRSDLAAQLLANNGFTNVFNVLPGMSAYSGPLDKDI